MRITLFALLWLFAGCSPKEERQRAEYVAAHEREAAAYQGSDAALAFREKLLFIEHVKKLEAEGAAGVPYRVVYIWDYARLGLLAEHLGKKEEGARYFHLASDYAKKAYPNEPESKSSEAALRSALDQMDTPEKIAWRKK